MKQRTEPATARKRRVRGRNARPDPLGVTNDGAADGGGASSADPLERECRELFNLSLYEVRVLLALLRAGSANVLQLARLAAVPRPSTYEVLDELASKSLAHRLPGTGPATWTCATREEILERLEAAQQARLRQYEEQLAGYRSRTSEVRQMLSDAFAQTMPEAFPYIRFVHGAAEANRSYGRVLERARKELVMYTRPPYSTAPGPPKRAVLDMLARGVTARVVYEVGHVDRPEFPAYHQAGVEGRVIESLPMKLAIADASIALVAVTAPAAPEGKFPTTLLIEHPGFASMLRDGFETTWAQARPLEAGQQPLS